MHNQGNNASTARFPFAEILPVITEAYGNTSWVVERLHYQKASVSLVALKQEVRKVVDQADPAEQLELLSNVRALASESISRLISTISNVEGDSFKGKLQVLLDAYETKFGWPFLIFTSGPRHRGMNSNECISAIEARIHNPKIIETKESLLQLHRIAEYQIGRRLKVTPEWGFKIWDKCEFLSRNSEEDGSLTVTFLSAAHQAVAADLKQLFQSAGFDEVTIDAVGNVVGRYYGMGGLDSPYLLTGSHYDTVRNGGAFDGRVGILIPVEFVGKLSSSNERLPFGIEVVAFSEEEGVRFPATFLGSGALVGDFQREWLNLKDANEISLQDSLLKAGLASSLNDIEKLKRDPKKYLGFVEIHIEQGPVLYKKGLPLGVVTAINGSRRYKLKLLGQASHAGTTPMRDRRDVACAAAEIVLFVESSAKQRANTVATVGVLRVLNGSINTVPGQCELSLDIRAPIDKDRDDLADAILLEIVDICKRRQLNFESQEVLRIPAAPGNEQLRRLWKDALQDIGLETFELPSGAGHDAMKMHQIMPQAMLFIRGENNGISHNPMESTDSSDLDLAFHAFEKFCLRLSKRELTSLLDINL